MDWNLKTPTWDLTQFVQETIPNIDSASGSSSFGLHGIKGDFSVDLKLGQVVDSANELGDNLKVPSVSKMASSPSGSSKRARAINNGVHIASCLVDGCTADLSNCRDYHRRHKVCELHSKTPQVTINGHNKRFCQQCSRFHSLEEFDEGKRSCRKRLDGHNRRRRKPQPEPLSRAGSFLSSNQGTRYLAFSSPQVYPTTTMASPIWAGVTKPNNGTKLYNNHSHSHLQDKQYPFQESLSRDTGHERFSFLHSTNLELSNQSAREAFVCQPLLKTPPESGSSSSKMLCDGFSNSDCALSLLSSSPTQTSSMGLSHPVHPGSIHPTHMFTPGLNYSGLQHMDSVDLVPNAGDTDDVVHCQRMFHMAPHATRDDSETPFYWD